MRSKQTKASTAELYDIRANLSRVKQNKNIGVGIRACTEVAEADGQNDDMNRQSITYHVFSHQDFSC